MHNRAHPIVWVYKQSRLAEVKQIRRDEHPLAKASSTTIRKIGHKGKKEEEDCLWLGIFFI